MEALALTRRETWSVAGSPLLRGSLIALMLILGLLAMHGVHRSAPAAFQATPFHATPFHGTTADSSSMHGTGTAVMSAAADTGAFIAPDAMCANCPSEAISMTVSCVAAVVLAFLLLLPGILTGRLRQAPRAGPPPHVHGLPRPSTPSLNFLCINRC